MCIRDRNQHRGISHGHEVDTAAAVLATAKRRSKTGAVDLSPFLPRFGLPPMKTPIASLLLALILPGTLLSSPEKSDDPATMPRKRILFFSKSSGFEHSVIRDPSLPFKAAPGSRCV